MHPAILALGGAFLLYVISGRTSEKAGLEPARTVKLNGHSWVLEQLGKGAPKMLGNVQGFDTFWLVSVPATSANAKSPILTYSQFLNDPTSRKVTARYPGVTAAQYNAVMTDFGIKETLPT